MGKKATAYTPEFTYNLLLFKHLDRISDSLREGMDINKMNTPLLMAYYGQVRFLEALLSVHLDQKFYERKREIMHRMPRFSKTWTNDLNASVSFFDAVSHWLELLLHHANQKELLLFKARSWEEAAKEFIDAEEGEESETTE